MIVAVEMYMAECDICGTNYEHGDYSCLGDKDSVKEDATEGGWHFSDDGKCYCDECHTIDDDDNLILNINNK